MVLFSLCKLASLDLSPSIMELGRHLGRIRHKFLPTDEKQDMAHLASSPDLDELESHVQELDRSKQQNRGPFHHL